MRDTSDTIDGMNETTFVNSATSTNTAPKARSWWEIRNATSDVAEVFIYDDIGEGWFTEGVTAKKFVEELKGITAPQIDLHLNSPGGSVFDGVAIYNALKRHPATVTTYVDGLAASIASVIALAGEKVVMASNALFMIHNPWGAVQGTAEEMRKMADVLDKVRDTLVGTYVDKTGMAEADVVAAMDAETWYTASEALDAGFVDTVGVELAVAASVDLMQIAARLPFHHVPDIQDAGRVLSQKNLDKITQAHKHLADVLSDATIDSETDGASDSAASDGASEPIHSETYVPGVGFARI